MTATMTAKITWKPLKMNEILLDVLAENSYHPLLEYRYYYDVDGDYEPVLDRLCVNLATETARVREKLRRAKKECGAYGSQRIVLCNDTGTGPRNERHIIAESHPSVIANADLIPLVELAYATVEKYESEPVQKPEPEITPHTICNEYNGDKQ